MRDGLAGKTTSITAAALGVDVCKSAKRLAAGCASRARPRGDRARPGWPMASRWPTTPGRQSSAPRARPTSTGGHETLRSDEGGAEPAGADQCFVMAPIT